MHQELVMDWHLKSTGFHLQPWKNILRRILLQSYFMHVKRNCFLQSNDASGADPPPLFSAGSSMFSQKLTALYSQPDPPLFPKSYPPLFLSRILHIFPKVTRPLFSARSSSISQQSPTAMLE